MEYKEYMYLPRIRKLSIASKISIFTVFVLFLGIFMAVLNRNQQQENRSKASGSASVSALVLVDTSKNKNLFPLVTGSIINKAMLPNSCITIRAITTPSTTGSVVFAFDGKAYYRTENTVPYDISGDDSNNLPYCWTMGAGSHTIIATPYYSSNGGGGAGTPISITFGVINQPMVTPPILSGTQANRIDAAGTGGTGYYGAVWLADMGYIGGQTVYRGPISIANAWKTLAMRRRIARPSAGVTCSPWKRTLPAAGASSSPITSETSLLQGHHAGREG